MRTQILAGLLVAYSNSCADSILHSAQEPYTRTSFRKNLRLNKKNTSLSTDFQSISKSFTVMLPLKPFPKLHLWLIIPFLLTLLDFANYWTGFLEAPLQWHLHGISATAWYIILIIQPWLYHHRPIQIHRKVGMLGILLAGFLTASAIGVIKGNLLQPEQSPLFDVRYSLSLVDSIFITGFMTSVIAGMWNAKKTQVHARWMISTVFWVLSPATTRLSFIPLRMIFQPKEFSDFPFHWVDVLKWNQFFVFLIVVILMILDYRKDKKYTSHMR